MIDYVMIDSLMKDKIKSFRIEDRIESDHLPMVMEVYGRTEKEKKKEDQWKKKKVWTEEGKRHYQGCVPLNARNVRDHDRKISRSTSSRSPRAKVLVERSAYAVSDINMVVVKQVATALLMRRRKYETDSSSSSDDDWEITLRERGKRKLRPRIVNYVDVVRLYTNQEFKSHFRLVGVNNLFFQIF